MVTEYCHGGVQGVEGPKLSYKVVASNFGFRPAYPTRSHILVVSKMRGRTVILTGTAA